MANKRQKSGAELVLKLRLDGPGLKTGRVPIPDLIRICEEAQNAVNKQAEALRSRKTIHPGPTSYSIQEECTLELVAIRGNSPTTLEFDLQHPQRTMHFREEFGAKVVRKVASTLSGLRRKTANNVDPGVLLSVYSLSGVISTSGINRIYWITQRGNGRKRWVSVAITQTVRERAAKRLSSPRKASVEVDGVLEMADFKREDYKCRIDPPIGPPVMCTFDPSRADEVQHLLRRYVHVRGDGVIHPYTDKIDSLHVEELMPLEPMALSDRSFFAKASIPELMADVKPIDDLSVFRGVAPDDEDIDAMLKIIYKSRK